MYILQPFGGYLSCKGRVLRSGWRLRSRASIVRRSRVSSESQKCPSLVSWDPGAPALQSYSIPTDLSLSRLRTSRGFQRSRGNAQQEDMLNCPRVAARRHRSEPTRLKEVNTRTRHYYKQRSPYSWVMSKCTCLCYKKYDKLRETRQDPRMPGNYYLQ